MKLQNHVKTDYFSISTPKQFVLKPYIQEVSLFNYELLIKNHYFTKESVLEYVRKAIINKVKNLYVLFNICHNIEFVSDSFEEVLNYPL